MAEIEAGFDVSEFTASSHLVCAITTRGGRVLWANDRLGRAFGPEVRAAIDRPLVELLDPYDRADALREMTRLGEAGDEVTFTARLHPVAGGFKGAWSCRVGEDGLLYLLGVDVGAEPADPRGSGRTPELHDLITRDHLTRTANRRSFEDALDVQLDRCRREGLPLTVALVDLDRFKHYNDTFGHLAGDTCLVTVAQAILQRTSREGELVGRFGGDEFLVLWPGIDVATAMRNAESLRQAVSVLDIRLEDHPVKVSVSIGGVTVVPTTATTPTTLMHAAERAMYAVKRAGGDGIHWVTDPAQVRDDEPESA